jgi:hypothetical protein
MGLQLEFSFPEPVRETAVETITRLRKENDAEIKALCDYWAERARREQLEELIERSPFIRAFVAGGGRIEFLPRSRSHA